MLMFLVYLKWYHTTSRQVESFFTVNKGILCLIIIPEKPLRSPDRGLLKDVQGLIEILIHDFISVSLPQVHQVCQLLQGIYILFSKSRCIRHRLYQIDLEILKIDYFYLPFRPLKSFHFLVVCRHQVLRRLRQVSQHRQGKKNWKRFRSLF